MHHNKRMHYWKIGEQLLLKLMLLDQDNNNVTGTCSHYGPSESTLLLMHRFFVLGAVSLLLLGAMYFIFVLLLDIIFLIKSLGSSLSEIISDTAPAIAGGVSEFWRVMLRGLCEIWLTCTRDNIQYIFSLAVVYHFLPMILSFCESKALDWRLTA
jgi:hypothetical protein